MIKLRFPDKWNTELNSELSVSIYLSNLRDFFAMSRTFVHNCKQGRRLLMSSLNTRPHTVVVHELCVVKQITRQEKSLVFFFCCFLPPSILPPRHTAKYVGEELLYD
jgi:hypothetical protein